MTARILIADDHEIVRQGICTLIERWRPEWEICGEVTNGREAVEAVKTLKPDVIILDITMPVMSGLEATPRIVKLGLGCSILIFTMHESARLPAEIRAAGAQGYVLKSRAARDLVTAVDRLLAGGTFFGGQLEADARKEGEVSGQENNQQSKAFPKYPRKLCLQPS